MISFTNNIVSYRNNITSVLRAVQINLSESVIKTGLPRSHEYDGDSPWFTLF